MSLQGDCPECYPGRPETDICLLSSRHTQTIAHFCITLLLLPMFSRGSFCWGALSFLPFPTNVLMLARHDFLYLIRQSELSKMMVSEIKPWFSLIQTKTTSFGWTKVRLFDLDFGPGEVSHLDFWSETN